MNTSTHVSGGLLGQAEVPRMREEPQFFASLDLVALPTAVPVARMFITDTLRRWHALFIEDHMSAVAVELVSLSVKATGPAEGTSWADITELNPIRLRMLGYQRHIVFEVEDVSSEALELSEDAELPQGTGLGLVDALANAWGARPTPGGRVIWAELAVYERTAVGLPRRRPPRSSSTPTNREGSPIHDREMLERVLVGLQRL